MNLPRDGELSPRMNVSSFMVEPIKAQGWQEKSSNTSSEYKNLVNRAQPPLS